VLLSGHSAGGHLASLLALRAGGPDRPPVQACLPISAIMDLHHPAPTAGSLEARVYDMVLQDPLQDAELSPIHWTARQRTPFDLTIGELDSERVRLSNRRIHALFRAQGLGAQLHVLAGHSHFDTHTALRDGSHPWYQRLQQHAQA
jgi:acetyl esterase/lipase